MSDRTIQIKYAQNPNAIPRRSWRGELAANAAGALFVGTKPGGGKSQPIGFDCGIKATAATDLVVGNFVSLSLDSGTISAKLATSIDEIICHGIAVNPAMTGDLVFVCTLSGAISIDPCLIEIAPDRDYYLSTTPGFGSIVPSIQSIGRSIVGGFIFNPKGILT